MNKVKAISELKFKAIRSGGPGGQHANKVSSKVQLLFSVSDSEALSDAEKARISKKLKRIINKEGILQLASETSRSQHKNKELVIERFLELLKKALEQPKKRKRTKPSKSSVEKRLNTKKRDSQKKADRKRPNLD